MLGRSSLRTSKRALLLLSLSWFLPASAVAAADQSTSELAERIVQRAGIPRGVCAVLGADGQLPIDLARFSELLLHVREPDPKTVAELQWQHHNH